VTQVTIFHVVPFGAKHNPDFAERPLRNLGFREDAVTLVVQNAISVVLNDWF
jgi:hypothetical protein